MFLIQKYDIIYFYVQKLKEKNIKKMSFFIAF